MLKLSAEVSECKPLNDERGKFERATELVRKGGPEALEFKDKGGGGTNTRKFDLGLLQRERHKYSLRDYLSILYLRLPHGRAVQVEPMKPVLKAPAPGI